MRPGIVERADLLRTLESSRNVRVVVVVAPAGYGKSTLLAQWAARDPRHSAWLTLDTGDNDPVLLLSHVLEALAGASALGTVKGSGGREPLEARLLGRILAELGGPAGPWVIVLDDVHALEEAAALHALAALVDRLPEGTQIALGTRSLPARQLPIGRWRAAADLLEIGVDRLAMGDDESRALFAALDIPLEAERAREIRSRTHGWAAATYLVGLSVKDHGWQLLDAAGSGQTPYVADYLKDHVLGPLTIDDRTLLMQSSILERLSGPLCDAVVERSGSAVRLKELARATLFLVPLDAEQRWFRCHPLLRDHLQRDLELSSPALVQALHRRASAWFMDVGAVEPAMEHAFAGRHFEQAATLAATVARELFERGEIATVRRWFARFETEAIEQRSFVAPIAAWLAGLDGSPDECERWVAAAEKGDGAGATKDGTASLESARAMARAMVCRDGPARMLADASSSLEAEPTWSPWRLTALLEVGYAQLMLGQEEEAQRCFSRIVRDGESTSTAAYRVALSERALAEMRGDRWDEAASLVRSFRRSSRSAGADNQLASLLGLVADIRILIHRGATDRARAELHQAQPIRRLVSRAIPWFGVRCLTELARAHLLVGDSAGARASITQAEEILADRPQLGALGDEVAGLRERSRHLPAVSGRATGMTEAELRLLPFLQSYLTFPEIGERLGVSRNTVKTHAASIYAKLGASSRSEAVEAAQSYGLLVPLPGVRPALDDA
jgi:LuxR family maltose regulon positive regulatory protein